ncbi:MAG: BrnA antitoxin family protein [Campylobacterales bacterium]|nr:BrnA antitoxin family protein [Campylobacterales bacterium]
MKAKTYKNIPDFATEQEAQEFWAANDSTEYINWNKAKKAKFPNLKPTLKTISIRLPESMIEELKIKANAMDVPYQSLAKMLIASGLHTKAV